MNGYYKIFTKGFNKILDLIEFVDRELANAFMNFVDNCPYDMLDGLSECKDYECSTADHNVSLLRLPNSLDVDFIRNKNYLRTNICVNRIFEEDLFEQDLNMSLFLLNQRNTEFKKRDIKLLYEYKNGKYYFVGADDKDVQKHIDITWKVDLQNKDGEFVIIVKKEFRGIEIYKKEIPISFDELMQCVEIEDEYEEDLEIDLDFDL